MKRGASSSFSNGIEAMKRPPRQDPVSCESCRKKKLKCNRDLPCTSCSARKIDCQYGGSNPGVKTAQLNESQTPAPASHNVSKPPRTLQWNPRPRHESETHTQSGGEPLRTVDWLENIVMGHRVPSAVPATVRAELSQHRDLETTSQHVSPVDRLGKSPLSCNENPATLDLPSYLPPLAEAMGLFRYYCKYLDMLYHIIIPSRAEQQIQKIYDCVAQNEQINCAHVALLLSIAACALYYQLLGEASEHAERISQETTFLAGAALIQGNYIGYPTIEGLQATMIIGHHLSNMNLPPSVSSLFVYRSFVSQAISMKFHLVDCPQAVQERTSTQSIDRSTLELKRRLWWDLATYDWLMGFLNGPQEWTYSIQPQHMIVNEPLNVEDEDIDQFQAGQPISTPTVMSYTLCRLRLAAVCRKIVEETSYFHLHGQEVPYEKVLMLDRELQKLDASIPRFFRFDQNSRCEYSALYRERPSFAWQRDLVQQGYHSRFCRLHRHYSVCGAKDPRYSYSHVISLQSARKVLAIKRMMDEEEPAYKPHSSVVWSTIHHVLMAAAILLINVCFNWDDILAEQRKEEVLDACRMLSRAQQSSPIAREGINAMMGILRKHWKHEKQRVTHGPQADPVNSVSKVAPQASQPAVLTPVSIGASVDVLLPPQTNDSSLDSSANLAPDPLPLEDVWTEMLDGGAPAALTTPDWTELLNELTNATMPSE